MSNFINGKERTILQGLPAVYLISISAQFGTNSSVSWRALEGLYSKSCLQFLVPRFQSDFEKTCNESCHNWIPLNEFPGWKKSTLPTMWSGGWNILQDITRSFVWELTINIPNPERFKRYSSWHLQSSPFMEKRPTYLCLGGISTELVQELIRGLDDLCPECCLQLLVPYFQSDFEDTCLESCYYWVQKKSPT